MTTTWSALAGDTSAFAIELSFSVDSDEHRYDEEERLSWGSITLWIDGVNVTEHSEQGELFRAAHWYLLPTIEWFAENWDALFHEERLPLSNAGSDAASAMTRLLIQPLRLVRSDLDEFERLEAWQRWWARHNVVDSIAGGLFPDVYIRRWGDLCEISIGSTTAPGTPAHFRYHNTNFVGHAPVSLVATSVFDVISRAADELLRRRPDSIRLQTLRSAIDALMDPTAERYAKRLAYLSGVDATSVRDLDTFVSLWKSVDESLNDGLEDAAREIAVGHKQGGLVLETAPQVALLFGSLAPAIEDADLQVLIRSLHETLSQRSVADIPCLKVPSMPAMSPGQTGSELGELAYRELADRSASFVDVQRILSDLGVTVSIGRLSDGSTRAVTLLAKGYGTHIVVNENYLRGVSGPVLRFTLAHELGHILFDQARSVQMAVASGPWAPKAVEQQANAFAAAFLMPEELIERNLSSMGSRPWSRGTAQRLANSLRVSLSSLADRMYNLMMITREEADSILYSRNQ